MARAAGKDANFSYNAVDIEDELNSIEMSVDVDVPEVTAFADAAKEFVEGKYGASFALSGAADLAASQGDATLFGQIGSGEAAIISQPDGVAAAAAHPNYTGNGIVRRYTLRTEVGGPISYSADILVNGALARAVA